MGYDKAGNKTSETDWRGNATRPTSTTGPPVVVRREPKGKVTRYAYDGVGNVTTETDAENRATDARLRRTQPPHPGLPTRHPGRCHVDEIRRQWQQDRDDGRRGAHHGLHLRPV